MIYPLDVDAEIGRFNQLYFGDSLLQVIRLDTAAAECVLRLSSGKKLRGPGASIFDPEIKYSPAKLLFRRVRAIAFDGEYQLNSTVVDFGASRAKTEEYIEYYFVLTGGRDPDAFVVTLRITASSFELNEDVSIGR